jgi:hypothetical protein
VRDMLHLLDDERVLDDETACDVFWNSNLGSALGYVIEDVREKLWQLEKVAKWLTRPKSSRIPTRLRRAIQAVTDLTPQMDEAYRHAEGDF